MNNPFPPPEEIYRKFKLVSDMFDFAYRIKSHQLRLKFPELTEEETKQKTLELIEKGCR